MALRRRPETARCSTPARPPATEVHPTGVRRVRPRATTLLAPTRPGNHACVRLQGSHQPRRPRLDAGLGAVHPAPAPAGAPNVLVVLYDDTGLAAWSPYGGRDQHADDAAAGRQRADVHAVAHDRAVLADPVVPPDRSQPPPERVRLHRRGRRPASRATTPTSRRRTRTIGQGAARGRLEHLLGRQEPQRADRRVGAGRAPRRTGRCAQGFDRFYGFIGGETNNWYPDLAEDNHYIDQPYRPRTATTCRRTSPTRRSQMIRDSQGDRADKPWYMWFCPGANHAPHHAPGGVHRQVQGRVRRRLRGLPRVGAAADDREGHPARGHRADRR